MQRCNTYTGEGWLGALTVETVLSMWHGLMQQSWAHIKCTHRMHGAGAQVLLCTDAMPVSTCSQAQCCLQAWGHSSVFSPFGECLATTDHEPGIVYADLDFKDVQTRRQNMPLADQKRYDLYELLDKASGSKAA